MRSFKPPDAKSIRKLRRLNGVTEKSRTRMAFMMYQRNISAAVEIILRALLALISGLNSMTCPKRRRTLYGKNTVQS